MSEEEAFRDLIQRVRAGDREAAAELVRLYEPEIRRFIRLQLNHSRLRRSFDSADIFQSVFLNFYVRVMGGQFDLEEPTQLLRLLATMARNRIIDHARKPSARAQDGGPDLWANVAADGASPSDAMAQEEILQQVLRRLTDEERNLAQKRSEGRSWQELADEYGDTADALRKRLARALERVCQELNPEGAAMRELVESVQAEQRSRWERGERVPIEDYLERYPALKGDATAVVDLIYGEVLLREELGEAPTVGEYLHRFTEFVEPLRRQFRLHECLRAGLLGSSVPPASRPTATESTLPLRRPSSPDGAAAFPIIPGFEILNRLGGGRQGIVYAARQLKPAREVAVKVIRHEDTEGIREEALFYRDAEAVAHLEHPNIIRLYEFGEHAGRSYYTMELAAGGSLQQRLTGGPLPPREAASLVEALARALHYAHERNIVHRDLKPANVLLTADGTPKVADFGLAKRVGRGDSLFPSGAIIGTVNYMPPEQASGAREVGPAADIWALGAILYECLTASPPFRGRTIWETLNQVRSREPTAPRCLQPAVPPDLETVCLKCLEKNPRHRYASAGELADRLRLVLDNQRIPDRPRGRLVKAWQAIGPHPRFHAAALLVGVLLAGLLLLNPRPASDSAQREANHPLERDPEQEKVTSRLAKGRRYEFRGTEMLPGPFRQVLGTAVPQLTPADRCFTVQLWDTGLLELVRDPGCDRYRFSAEVRHQSGAGISFTGLYFGYRERQMPRGGRQALFFTLTFADRGVVAGSYLDPNGQPLSRVGPDCWLCEPRPGHLYTPTMPLGELTRFRPAFLPRTPSPWRVLEVEVTPREVKACWRPSRDGPKQTLPLQVAWLNQEAGRLVQNNAAFTGLPADFRPRAGLGLYVHKSKTSFRRVTLEPLPGGR